MYWTHHFPVIFALLCCAPIPPADGEIFSSILKLKVLCKIETSLLTTLQQYVNLQTETRDIENHSIDEVKRFLSETQAEAFHDNAAMENAVNSFHIIYRFVVKWHHIKEIVYRRLTAEPSSREASRVSQDFLNIINVLQQREYLWPDNMDLQGAALGLLRIVEIYKISLNALARGKFLGANCAPLTTRQFMTIANQAQDMDMQWEAVKWYNYTIRMTQRSHVMASLASRAYKQMADCLYKLGRPDLSVDTIRTLIGKKNFTGSIDHHLQSELRFYEQRSGETVVKRPLDRPLPKWTYYGIYERLCRQETQRGVHSKLSCSYQSTYIPYLRFRKEMIHENPPIMLYHNIVSDYEIALIKNTTIRRLDRSSIGNKDPSKPAVGHARISQRLEDFLLMDRNKMRFSRILQDTWLPAEDQMSVVLSERIKLVTGLETQYKPKDTNSELFEVINYGLGGLYMPHHDYVHFYRKAKMEDIPVLQNSGDRIATFLFYLSEVRSGGATVFPKLNTRVAVTKGAAALWYNLRRNGSTDERLLHGGCPVALGDKWVSTKWIREVGQIFRRPCLLDPSS